MRNVKWLGRVVASTEEAEGPWQRGLAYKGFSPMVKARAKGWVSWVGEGRAQCGKESHPNVETRVGSKQDAHLSSGSRDGKRGLTYRGHGTSAFAFVSFVHIYIYMYI